MKKTVSFLLSIIMLISIFSIIPVSALESDAAAEKGIQMTGAVSSVEMKDLEAGSNTITVKWNAVEGASKYRVSYKRSYWNYWKKLSDTTSLSYTDKNFTDGVTYSYSVLPLDSKGNVLNSVFESKSITYRNAPKNVKANASTSQGCINITWDEVKGCSQYQVFYRRSTQSSWRRCKGTATTNSYTDTNCSNDVTYYYTVRCLENGCYSSGYADKASIHYYKIPENVKAEKYDDLGRIKITWDKVEGASKYQVFYRRSTQNTWHKCKGYASGTSYTDTGCSDNITYYYTVRACSSDGKFISSYDPQGAVITYTKTVYAVPSNIRAEKQDDLGNIKITWNAVSGAPKYQVLYKREGWTQWKNCKGYTDTNSYTDTGCSDGITYYYTVRVCREDGSSGSGFNSTGTKITYKKTVYDTPSNLMAEKYNEDGKIKITWNAVDGAPKYQVFYRRSTQNTWHKCKGFAKTNSYIDTGCSSGVTYFYTVRVCHEDGAFASGYDQNGVEITCSFFNPVPLNKLANYSSLKQKMTDAEFKEAYNYALSIVSDLAGLSREEQLYAIAVRLRELYESGIEYSTSNPHYNDPYGYFIARTASCAGCTRATGLCLNILGISYEHVNENAWSHQWCRVNINGTYWICDAYGLYCGPEPSPYKHPYISVD